MSEAEEMILVPRQALEVMHLDNRNLKAKCEGLEEQLAECGEGLREQVVELKAEVQRLKAKVSE